MSTEKIAKVLENIRDHGSTVYLHEFDGQLLEVLEKINKNLERIAENLEA